MDIVAPVSQRNFTSLPNTLPVTTSLCEPTNGIPWIFLLTIFVSPASFLVCVLVGTASCSVCVPVGTALDLVCIPVTSLSMSSYCLCNWLIFTLLPHLVEWMRWAPSSLKELALHFFPGSGVVLLSSCTVSRTDPECCKKSTQFPSSSGTHLYCVLTPDNNYNKVPGWRWSSVAVVAVAGLGVPFVALLCLVLCTPLQNGPVSHSCSISTSHQLYNLIYLWGI